MFAIIVNPGLSEYEKCEAIAAGALKNPQELTKIWLGQTLLHVAVAERLLNVSLLLLKLGCSIDAEDYDKKTILHYAVELGFEEFIFLCGYHKCNFNAVDKKLETALHIAIKNNRPACVKNLLIASKFTIDKTLKNKDGHTAEDLLRKKTDIKAQPALAKAFTMVPDLFKRTPLHLAVINNLPDLVQLHIMLGAPVNEQDGDGQAALHFAALCGHASILLMLCYHEQINMNLAGQGGNTALHCSIAEGQPDCVKILVSAKNPANKYIENNDHLTPLDLIKKSKSKELVLKLEQALLSTQLSNGLSEQYEKEMFTFEQVNPGNYMLYLKEHFKELAFSVKTVAEEKTSPRQSMDGHTFKLFGRKSSPRKQANGMSISLEGTLSDKETMEEEHHSHILRRISTSPNSSREKLSSSNAGLASNDKEKLGEESYRLTLRRKSSTSPRKKVGLLNAGLISSDKESLEEGSPRLIVRRKSSTSSTGEKINLSNVGAASGDKEKLEEESHRLTLGRKSSTSPRKKVSLLNVGLISSDKEALEEDNTRSRGKRVTLSDSPREKLALLTDELTINDKKIIGDDELLDKIYLERDVSALVSMIESAQTKNELISLIPLFKKFIETQYNKEASNFLTSAFSKLESKLSTEQQDFDDQCIRLCKNLRRKLLFDGLKKGCSTKDINQVTEEQFLSISTHKETIKKLRVLVEMCSGKAAGISDVVINTNDAVITYLGLMDFVAPEEIIALLIKLHPIFTTIQKLQSNYIVFTLITLHDFYGYDGTAGPLAEQLRVYMEQCCEVRVVQCINDYIQTINRFKTNSLHAVIKQLQPVLDQARGAKKDSIIGKIDEFAKQDSINLRCKEIQLLVNYVTQEFNTINALFYQSFLLKELRRKCWENENKDYVHTGLSEYARLVNQMMEFVKRTICAYELPQQQAQAITLFILVARESLHYQYGPDLTSLMVIACALQLYDVSTLKKAFDLLDHNILKIFKKLQAFSSPSRNYHYYRGLLAAAPCALPFLAVIFGDKVHLYDVPQEETQDNPQDTPCNNPYVNVSQLGMLHKSLIVIKKNLQHLSLDSHSDLLEQLQKNNIQPNKGAVESNVVQAPEPSSKKQKRLSLFSPGNPSPKLDRTPSDLELSHLNDTSHSAPIDPPGPEFRSSSRTLN